MIQIIYFGTLTAIIFLSFAYILSIVPKGNYLNVVLTNFIENQIYFYSVD